MGLPVIVDIAIGLVFGFLILSLFASELLEIITTILQWRAKHLKESIEILFSGAIAEESRLTPDQRKILLQTREKSKKLADYLYAHPLIKSLNYENTGAIARLLRKITHLIDPKPMSGPSAMPSDTFAVSILQTLHIDHVVREINAEKLGKFRQRIEQAAHKAFQHIKDDPAISDEIKTSLKDIKLKKTLSKILDQFTQNQITLNQAFNKLYEQYRRYMEVALEKLLDDEPKRLFLLELTVIDEEIFWDNQQAVWLEDTQVSVAQVLRIYKEFKESIDESNTDTNISAEKSLMYHEIAGFISTKNKENQLSNSDFLANIPSNLIDSLLAIADQTQVKVNDFEEELREFRRGVEDWFDKGMQRASGVYKRNSKGIAFVLGMMIAILANVDTFYVINQLSQDSVLRDILVEQASNIDANTSSESLSELKDELDSLSLPVGWDSTNRTQQALYRLGISQSKNSENSQDKQINICTETKPCHYTIRIWGWFKQISGWLLSGIAISMGAPFWFDLLNKVVDVKNTGGPAKPNKKEGA